MPRAHRLLLMSGFVSCSVCGKFYMQRRDHVLCLAVVFVTEGPLKKLYERIRSQRDNWQQRSLQESREIDAAVDGSPSESAVHQRTCGEGSLLILCMYCVVF